MNRQFPQRIGLAGLLAVSFVTLHWLYGYVIAWQSERNECFFMFGRQFLLEFLDYPGGLLEYAGRLLGQFYHHRWLGALILSVSITWFGVLFRSVLVKLKGAAGVLETLVPCFVLLALHTSTVYLVSDTLGLMASCGAFWGYLSCRGTTARRVYALACTPLLYVLLGAYWWFFVVWVAAFEQLDSPVRSGLVFKIAYIVLIAAVPLAAWRWVFPIPFRAALACPILFAPTSRSGLAPYSVTQLVMDCLLAAVLCASLFLTPFEEKLFAGARLAPFWPSKVWRWKRVVLAGAMAILAVLVHFIRYDAPLKNVVAWRQLYSRGGWDALLEKARENRSGDKRLQFMTNFALARKRRLLDEMFHYPQMWGPGGLVFKFSGSGASPADDDTYLAMYNSDLFYELGHVNIAFVHAFNYASSMGTTCDTLERMAQCSMVVGRIAMAAEYWKMLGRTLFHSGPARRLEAAIADPGAAEREFGGLRKRLPAVDFPNFSPLIVHLDALLARKPDNRMAFDYRTARLLLDKENDALAAIADSVERFRAAGYDSLPIHCQEALLVWERERGSPVNLHGFRFHERTRERVERFFQDAAQCWGRQNAGQRLQPLYGNTYMFYHYFAAPRPQQPSPMPELRPPPETLRRE